MELVGFTNWHDEMYQRIEDSTESDLAERIVIEYMKQHNLRFTGTYHQCGEFGAPYFETNQKLCMSMRSWGDLMVRVLDIEDKRGMEYCTWAWCAPEEEILPYANMETKEDLS